MVLAEGAWLFLLGGDHPPSPGSPKTPIMFSRTSVITIGQIHLIKNIHAVLGNPSKDLAPLLSSWAYYLTFFTQPV